MPGVLAQKGYHTCSIGKIHLSPWGAPAETEYEESRAYWRTGKMDYWNGPYYGFKEVQLASGHGDACYANFGHYGRWVNENFKELAQRASEYGKGKTKQFGRSAIPLEAHHSTWIANQSIEYIKKNKDKPFCLYVSFPDPHHPFVTPEKYYNMFEGADFPAPHFKEGENDRKPFHYKRAMTEKQHPKDGGAHRPLEFTEKDWQVVRTATYGAISLIDHSVGRVLDCLRDQGLEDNTTIAFTSDHGDLMGDHYFLYKGPYPTRSLLNIPFIIADPDCAPRETGAVMSNVDAMPTLLDLLGVPIPPSVQGRSFKDVTEGKPEDKDHVALCSGWSKDSHLFYHHSIYGSRYRITYFPNQDDGELYDLEQDPYEFDNLYHDPKYRGLRDELMLRLLKELGRAEPHDLQAPAWW